MNIDIIGVPVYYGCDVKGAEMAPDMLRQHGLIGILSGNHNVRDMGNVAIPYTADNDKFATSEDCKYLDSIVSMNKQIFEVGSQSLAAGHLPFTVGGDHSLCIGSIAAAAAADGEIAVIWVDAHADMNTDKTSITKNIHGMGMGAAMGMGHQKLTEIGGERPCVKPENVFMIGVRDFDPEERLIFEKSGVSLCTIGKIKEFGVPYVVREIMLAIRRRGIGRIHLSFDLDSIDPQAIPGVSVPVADGLTIDESICLVSEILRSGLVKSIDFVEYNPLKDQNNITLRTCLDIIKHIDRLLMSK